MPGMTINIFIVQVGSIATIASIPISRSPCRA
jgi:hypothetical protein